MSKFASGTPLRPLALGLLSRGAGSVTQLLINLALGNWYGAATVGTYYFFLSWFGIVSTIGSLGIPRIALREIARRVSERNPEGARLFQSWATKAVLITMTTTFAALLLIQTIVVNAVDIDAAKADLFLRAAFYAIIAAQLQLMAESLKGTGRISTGLFVEFAAIPIIFVAVILLSRWAGYEVSPSKIVDIYILIGSVPVVLYVAWFLTRNRARREFSKEIKASILPFWSVSVVNTFMVGAPYIILSFIASPVEIGLFAVAHRVIGVSGTLIQVLAGIYSPKFAQAKDSNSHNEIFRAARITTALVTVPVLITFLLFSNFFLGIFGDDFGTQSATRVFMILGFSRLIISLMGLPEAFLCMSGAEKYEFQYSVLSAVSFVPLAIFLGLKLGIVGVAVAYAVSTVGRAALSYRRSKLLLKGR